MKSQKLVKVIKISSNVQRISISNDDHMVFAADQTSPRLAVIDTSKNTVESWISLPGVAYGTGTTFDGRWLLVSLPNDCKVAVVDMQTMKVVRTIAVPKGPHTVAMSHDKKTAYVACMKGNQVAAISVVDWSVKRLIPVGNNATGLAWLLVP